MTDSDCASGIVLMPDGDCQLGLLPQAAEASRALCHLSRLRCSLVDLPTPRSSFPDLHRPSWAPNCSLLAAQVMTALEAAREHQGREQQRRASQQQQEKQQHPGADPV